MDKLRCAALTAALMVASGSASADLEFISHSYWSVGYAAASYEEDGLDESIDIGAVSAAFGRRFSRWYALEGRIGVGIQDEDFSYSDPSFGIEADVSFSMDNFLGIYNKLFLFGASAVSPYAVVGLTTGKAEMSVSFSEPGFEYSDSSTTSDTDLSIGVGVDIGGDRWFGTIEYMRYYDQSDYSLDAFTGSFGYKF